MNGSISYRRWHIICNSKNSWTASTSQTACISNRRSTFPIFFSLSCFDCHGIFFLFSVQYYFFRLLVYSFLIKSTSRVKYLKYMRNFEEHCCFHQTLISDHLFYKIKFNCRFKHRMSTLYKIYLQLARIDRSIHIYNSAVQDMYVKISNW